MRGLPSQTGSSDAHIPRSECRAGPLLFGVPSGTSGTRPAEIGRQFQLRVLPWQQLSHASIGTERNAGFAAGVSPTSGSAATSGLRAAKTQSWLHPDIFVILEWASGIPTQSRASPRLRCAAL